jgi:putative lipoprotein
MKKILLLLIIFLLFSCLQAENHWLGKDKVMHFTGSAFLTFWNYGFSQDILEISGEESLYFSISFTALLGTSKEYSDKRSKSTGWSWPDLAYNLAGITLGVVLINNLR